MSEGTYEFLEHTSDAYVVARGRDLEGAFAAAARAMCDIITDSTKVRPVKRVKIKVAADDLKSLLYNWLESLIVKFEVDGMVFSRHSLRIGRRDGGYALRAISEGEKFDPAVHPRGTSIKAVTYHGMEIARGEDTSEVRVLFDI